MNNQKNIKINNHHQLTSNNKKTEYNTPLKFCTHNVRGLSTQSKQFQLMQYIELNNIHIMGLSETKLKNSTAKYCFKKLNNYISYFENSSSSPQGAGVGFLIHKNVAKFIHKVGKFNGRIIYVDLFFKEHNRLRIIQIYLHANIQNRKEIDQTYNMLSNIVKEAHNNNTKIILMGDFNISPEKRHIDPRK